MFLEEQGGDYTMHNRVTAFEQGRSIAWAPGSVNDEGRREEGGHVWRYDLAPAGDKGTEVTLTYEWSAMPQEVRDGIPGGMPVVPREYLDRSLAALATALGERPSADEGSVVVKRLPTEPLGDQPRPEVVDRATWQAQLDELLVREKAHTREGDAIAAARRRLPMVEVPATATVVGPDGPVPFVEAFEGRRLLVAYFHMWHDGEPWEEQCEGCTFSTSQMQVPEYLNARDVTLAVFAEGTYEESRPYADWLGWPTAARAFAGRVDGRPTVQWRVTDEPAGGSGCHGG